MILIHSYVDHPLRIGTIPNLIEANNGADSEQNLIRLTQIGYRCPRAGG